MDAVRTLNVLSVDLEDYFQVTAFDGIVGFERWPQMERRLEASTDRVLQLLADANVRATFFVLGWNAERLPAVIRRIAAAGHEIASHGYAHQLVYDLTREEFRADIKRASRAIEDAAGVPVVGYRAPSYSVTGRSLWALQVLVEEGYRFDSSIFPIWHDRYGLPHARRHPYLISAQGGSLWEVPPATVRLGPVNVPVAGGGYLRLLPFSWSRWGLRHINLAEGHAATVYVHPWEMDAAQPRLGVGGLTRLRHYGNLNRTEDRVRRLLAEFRFAPIGDVLDARAAIGIEEKNLAADRGRTCVHLVTSGNRQYELCSLEDVERRAAKPRDPRPSELAARSGANRIALEETRRQTSRGALTLTTDVTPREWDDWVVSRPEASTYHAWRWREIFEQAFPHETLYLAARLDGQICGVLPFVVFRSWLFGRFLISLPFVNYGGLLADDDEVAGALVDRAVSFAETEHAAFVELRHVSRRLPMLSTRTHKVGMTRALPRTSAEAWSGLDRKVRNQIRKATRSGLTVETGGADELDRFYGVFAKHMRDLGTPVYSRTFFESVLDKEGDRASCVIVRQGRRPVAAALSLRHRDTVEIPWAASLKRARPTCANSLLYWTILEQAVADGFSTLDLGRSSPDSGPYHFKRQWGATPQPLHWECALAPGGLLPSLAPANPKFKVAIATWKRLPVSLANLIGPRIVQSIP
jgi:FemAB-related protein (PEP-CTERM system-associated)